MRHLIVLAGLALVLCISPALSEITRITRTNGGANGYNYVEETHSEPVIGENKHTLACSNPGFTICDWMIRPSVRHQDMADYAENKISQGILSGVYTATISGIVTTVTWSVTGGTTTIEVTDGGIN